MPWIAFYVERETGIEPATSTLARWSSTAELLPLVVLIRTLMVHTLKKDMREKGLEPIRLKAPDPKSGVSANFTTLAVSCGDFPHYIHFFNYKSISIKKL